MTMLLSGRCDLVNALLNNWCATVGMRCHADRLTESSDWLGVRSWRVQEYIAKQGGTTTSFHDDFLTGPAP